MTAAALGIAVATAGATLLLRRLSGGFAPPPSAAVPWAVAIAGIPLLLAVEATARLAGEGWPAAWARGGLVAAALAVAPLAVPAMWPMRAIGLAGTAVALVAALWPAVGRWLPRVRAAIPPSRPGRAAAADGRGGGSGMGIAAAPNQATRPADLPGCSTAWSGTPAAGFRQRLERFEGAAGEDCVRGQVMIPVASGSRSGHAHVGFCPAFATLPDVEVTTDCDFVEAEVTAAEILPWGVRVECRLSEPAEEPLEIPVTFQAVRPL